MNHHAIGRPEEEVGFHGRVGGRHDNANAPPIVTITHQIASVTAIIAIKESRLAMSRQQHTLSKRTQLRPATSAMGQTQKSRDAIARSALPPSTDIVSFA